MKKEKGYESTEMKIKVKELLQIFPNVFGHITMSDFLFLRIDEKGGEAIKVFPLNEDPWQHVLPYKYIFVIYQEFDINKTVDQQMLILAHNLLKIPKDYHTNNVLRQPEIVMFGDEHKILEWLETHKFNLT